MMLIDAIAGSPLPLISKPKAQIADTKQAESSRVATCAVICDDSRKALSDFVGEADLIVTSPPYADVRQLFYGLSATFGGGVTWACEQPPALIAAAQTLVMTRIFSRSNFARPYIWRLMSFRRLT